MSETTIKEPTWCQHWKWIDAYWRRVLEVPVGHSGLTVGMALPDDWNYCPVCGMPKPGSSGVKSIRLTPELSVEMGADGKVTPNGRQAIANFLTGCVGLTPPTEEPLSVRYTQEEIITKARAWMVEIYGEPKFADDPDEWHERFGMLAHFLMDAFPNE